MIYTTVAVVVDQYLCFSNQLPKLDRMLKECVDLIVLNVHKPTILEGGSHHLVCFGNLCIFQLIGLTCERDLS